MQQVLINITTEEQNAIVIALKRSGYNNIVDKFEKINKNETRLYSNEFIFAKKAISELLEMFVDLDACHDAVYQKAKIVLRRLDDISTEEEIYIKLCESTEPFTLEELAALASAVNKYCAAYAARVSYFSAAKLKPIYQIKLENLVIDLQNAKVEIMDAIQSVMRSLEVDEDDEFADYDGGFILTIKSAKALLSITEPIMHNPEAFDIAPKICDYLHTGSEKLRILLGQDKVEIDYSNPNLFSDFFSD